MKTITAMKNTISMFAFALVLFSTPTFATGSEEKGKVDVKNTLPVNLPAIESPAPEKKDTAVKKPVQYTPEQKAAIVELTLTGSGK
jgi:hypothetical protein